MADAGDSGHFAGMAARAAAAVAAAEAAEVAEAGRAGDLVAAFSRARSAVAGLRHALEEIEAIFARAAGSAANLPPVGLAVPTTPRLRTTPPVGGPRPPAGAPPWAPNTGSRTRGRQEQVEPAPSTARPPSAARTTAEGRRVRSRTQR